MSQKILFGKIKTDAPQYLQILQIGHMIYHTQVKRNNSPCSEHIFNEEFQSSELILSRQQTSLGNIDLNVDLEPNSPPSPASSTPPGYP